MRIRCYKQICMPRQMKPMPGLLGQKDIQIGSGRLFAKVLIFNNNRNLCKFWKKYTGYALGRYTRGAVNALSTHTIEIGKDGSETNSTLWVDPRYFCLVGLINTHLTLPIIAHEAVHVGFCFARRKARSPWDAQIKHFEEEAIAYPAGEFVKQMIAWLDKMT